MSAPFLPPITAPIRTNSPPSAAIRIQVFARLTPLTIDPSSRRTDPSAVRLSHPVFVQRRVRIDLTGSSQLVTDQGGARREAGEHVGVDEDREHGEGGRDD